MRQGVIATGLALIMILSGCGSAGPAENQSTAPKGGSRADAQRIEQMADPARNAVFYRAIIDAGHICQQVVSSTRSGESNGIPIWQARCRGGGSWFIAITANGYAQIAPAGPEPAPEHPAGGNSTDRR